MNETKQKLDSEIFILKDFFKSKCYTSANESDHMIKCASKDVKVETVFFFWNGIFRCQGNTKKKYF